MRLTRVFFLLLVSIAFVSVNPLAASATLETAAEHAVLMDAETGQVLWAKDATTASPPASMSKLMTLELLFQRLKDSRVKLTDAFPVSQRAWSTQGSKGFAMIGARIPVETLIRGIIIASANDMCVVVAESLGGSVEAFADMMNARAKQLGLAQSHFVNPDGLPDPPGQMMSAMDLAKLARHLIATYPQYYHYFAERSFSMDVGNGHSITQQNRDSVLDKFPGTDGLKTGHTDAAGFCRTKRSSAHSGAERLALSAARQDDAGGAGLARRTTPRRRSGATHGHSLPRVQALSAVQAERYRRSGGGMGGREEYGARHGKGAAWRHHAGRFAARPESGARL
jgi:D-alanyl-D-alanine carboxypeptidase (penicillin-binding protein 5/6)